MSCNGKPSEAGEGRPGWLSRGSAAAGWISRDSAVAGWLGGSGNCCKDRIDLAGGSRMPSERRTSWVGRLSCAARIDLLLGATI